MTVKSISGVDWMGSKTTLADWYDDFSEFALFLSWAEANVSSELEKSFVTSTMSRFSKYAMNGHPMNWSAKQQSWLLRIADKENGKYVDFVNE